jgi:hypothetical protein
MTACVAESDAESAMVASVKSVLRKYIIGVKSPPPPIISMADSGAAF